MSCCENNSDLFGRGTASAFVTVTHASPCWIRKHVCLDLVVEIHSLPFGICPIWIWQLSFFMEWLSLSLWQSSKSAHSGAISLVADNVNDITLPRAQLI